MWIEEVEELFKGYLPYYVLIVLPIFVIVSPINPIAASHELNVYRMQHFDLQGVTYGCRSASINLEARSLTGRFTTRHCVVTKIQDLTPAYYQNVRAKAGGLVIVIPQNLSLLSHEDRQHVMTIESVMLQQEITIPVYFAKWSPELETILLEISQTSAVSDQKKSATDALLTNVAGNGYQIVINPGTPSAKSDVRLYTIQGMLPGLQRPNQDSQVPTIVIVAHYDSFGVVPELSFGADSNGSGVAILMELARLFSLLYADPKTQGKHNLLFLLTGGGKIGFIGSKKWLEEQLDQLDHNTIQFLESVSYVMCLDSLASSDTFYLQATRLPKEGTATHSFYADLNATIKNHPDVTVEGVAKKTQMADEFLAWEHDRFIYRRVPAFTLSTIKNHKDPARRTILDTSDVLDMDRLERNTRVIAETLVRQVYKIQTKGILSGSLKVQRGFLEAWTSYVGNQPRSPQIVSKTDNPFVNALRDSFHKYFKNTKTMYTVPEKRDPEFVLYEVTKGTLNVYSVKPAVFDLVLTAAIVMYLMVMYFAIQKFSIVYNKACAMTAKDKAK